MEQNARLSVGELASAAGLTAKALRHYDRLGLFRPDGVDEANGYRWYAAARLPEARLIAGLRSVGVPLDDVAECVAFAGDPDVVDRVLARHRRRLESRLTRVRGDLHRLAHLSQDLLDGDREGDPTPPTELPASPPTAAATRSVPDDRQLAVDLFNGVWTLLETEDRTPAQDDRMLHMAHASRFHWEQAGTAVNLARGEWQCSRVYAALGRPEPALHHARRVLELCEENGIGDWDLAFAHEAIARACALAGDLPGARVAVGAALAAADRIADPDDRELLLADLRTLPEPVRPAEPTHA